MKFLVRIAVLSAVLLLGGCLVSDAPAILPDASAPDISGKYVSGKKIFTLTKSEKGKNSYDVAVNGKPGGFILIGKLDNNGHILVQMSEKTGKKPKENMLFPIQITKEGVVIFKILWGKIQWKPIFEKYKLSHKYYSGNPPKMEMSQGSMTPERYREAVKSAYKEMAAARMFGEGDLYKKQ